MTFRHLKQIGWRTMAQISFLLGHPITDLGLDGAVGLHYNDWMERSDCTTMIGRSGRIALQ